MRSPLQCLTLTLLILPPLLLTTYWFATFPSPPSLLPVNPSLAALPPSSQARVIYPESFYSDGAYVTLPHGRVRYWLLGPDNGKKIVLIHGLSVPSLIFSRLVPLLTAANHRVLLYDLYGRGYSDAPQVTYDATLYATQLALLMQHVKWDKARLVGLSMGGGVASYFAQMFPWLVERRMALLASTGLIESTDISRTVKFMSSPLIQTLASPFIRKYMQRLANKTINAPLDPIPDIVRLQSAHLPGYNFAVASSIRDGPVRGLAHTFKEIGRSGRSVLIIHGTKDHTVPYHYAEQIQNLLHAGATSASNASFPSPSPPSMHFFGTSEGKKHAAQAECKLVTLEGAGHDLVLDRAEEIGRSLVEWFAGPE